METHENSGRPTPSEAAAALEAAEQARAAGNAPLRAWLLPVTGLLVAGVMLAQPLADIAPLATLALLAVLGLGWWLAERLYSRQVSRAGIAPRHLTLPQQLVLAAPLPPLWIAGQVLDDRWSWVWLVAAVLSAGWITAYGIVHNRRARNSEAK
ncbi:hypothetical protein ACFXJ8_07410 [Nonomuraea sp. NPDC059194]|uniref:hypothetical protein n=1 Tax=Nonomuraea sp. NPDC059194 TaxID=3346764 RepID=UPI0036D02058